MADPVGTVTSVFGSGASKAASYSWVLWLILGAAIFITIVYFLVQAFKTKEKWNLKIRVYQENNQHGTLYLDPIVIKARRVTLSNGLRLIYLQKEILGKKLFPLLNYYTRPGVYDLVVSSDNRIFIVTGITGIDEQRKQLKVGIRYPGIDYSLDEVNRDHAKLNQLDRRNDLLGIVKAAASAVIAIVILIALIMVIKGWNESKAMDAQIAQSELQLFQSLEQYQLGSIEQTNAMSLLVEKLKEVMGTQDLRRELNNIAST
jgi:hypothetical protein